MGMNLEWKKLSFLPNQISSKVSFTSGFMLEMICKWPMFLAKKSTSGVIGFIGVITFKKKEK